MENGQNHSTGKTKAKKRYLKRKKERKKLRKASGRSSKALEEDGIEDEHESVDASFKELPPVLETKAFEESHRPKKKRKIIEEPSAEPEEVRLEKTEIIEDRLDEGQVDHIPRFPEPSQPLPPSKSALALQGLDQALVDGEIVQASKTTPIEEYCPEYFSPKTLKRLQDVGITELFAVQTALIPFLMHTPCRQLYLNYDPPSDSCVSAPTGSGKTLAYVVPIIEILSKRIVTRLRALIVLPTRDLVSQVRETFEAIGKGQGLKIVAVTGQHSFTHEQNQLVADRTSRLEGGSSKVDILICTPGRLLDHLNGTPNFTLQHLRFMVIDEADRLLSQSFQDWLSRVIKATQPVSSNKIPAPENTNGFAQATPDAIAMSHSNSSLFDFPSDQRQSSCQKLLFSATLTRDPGKLKEVSLRDVKYFVVSGQKDITTVQQQPNDVVDERVMDVVMERFSLPETLTEHMFVCSTASKPLVFFHMICNLGLKDALVFTKSVESTHRLVKLYEFFAELQGFKGVRARAYTSDLPAGERKELLEDFKKQHVQILVCSDLISRGIDLPAVSHVISYDIPMDLRKYTHRVGRTARAGRNGDAWSLVEDREARWFKSLMRGAGRLDGMKKTKMKEIDVNAIQTAYEVALERLKDYYGKGQ